MEQFKIKPSSSNTYVLDPITFKALKQKGETKPKNEYWLSRVRDSDAVIIADK